MMKSSDEAKKVQLTAKARRAELNDAYFEVEKREARSFKRNVIIASVVAAGLVGFGLTQFFSIETLKDCVAYEQVVSQETGTTYIRNGMTTTYEYTKISVSTSCGSFTVTNRTKVEWLLNGHTYDLQVHNGILIDAKERK